MGLADLDPCQQRMAPRDLSRELQAVRDELEIPHVKVDRLNALDLQAIPAAGVSDRRGYLPIHFFHVLSGLVFLAAMLTSRRSGILFICERVRELHENERTSS